MGTLALLLGICDLGVSGLLPITDVKLEKQLQLSQTTGDASYNC